MTAGNLRDRTLKVEPTGEKHSTTLSCLRTLSMKNFQQFSRVSKIPAPFTSFLTPERQKCYELEMNNLIAPRRIGKAITYLQLYFQLRLLEKDLELHQRQAYH